MHLSDTVNSYHPEPYWNEVAQRISSRGNKNIIAGDEEPYYYYKRNKFLKIFHSIPFKNKIVLELGSGPGGNLAEVLKHAPQELHGADISDEMIELASGLLKDANVQITKTNGLHLPYPDNYFDIVFTSTVLQHNTDDKMLETVIKELCRVSKNEIYIFERIEKKVKGDALCLGRPVFFYKRLFGENKFDLVFTKFLNVHFSYLVSGSIRKLFNSKSRKEGEKPTGLSKFLQKITLPLTSSLDRLLPVNRDVGMLYFKKRNA